MSANSKRIASLQAKITKLDDTTILWLYCNAQIYYNKGNIADGNECKALAERMISVKRRLIRKLQKVLKDTTA